MRTAETILVVDDDEAIREAVSDILGEEGYEVATAADGAEALARLRDGLDPLVILLDLMMPGMNGRQFIEAVRTDARLARVPILVLTADVNVAFDPAALPASGFLRKPFKLEQLTALVDEYRE